MKKYVNDFNFDGYINIITTLKNNGYNDIKLIALDDDFHYLIKVNNNIKVEYISACACYIVSYNDTYTTANIERLPITNNIDLIKLLDILCSGDLLHIMQFLVNYIEY
jgi:hypothetical protein